MAVRQFTVIILGFIVVSPIKINIPPNAVNQCERKTVREVGLSDKTQEIAKSIACRITSVKQCTATPTVLLLCTQYRS
jgi:hypothetical protein